MARHRLSKTPPHHNQARPKARHHLHPAHHAFMGERWLATALRKRTPRHPHRGTHTAAPTPRHPHRGTHTAAPTPRHPHRGTHTAAPTPRHPHRGTHTRHPHRSTHHPHRPEAGPHSIASPVAAGEPALGEAGEVAFAVAFAWARAARAPAARLPAATLDTPQLWSYSTP